MDDILPSGYHVSNLMVIVYNTINLVWAQYMFHILLHAKGAFEYNSHAEVLEILNELETLISMAAKDQRKLDCLSCRDIARIELCASLRTFSPQFAKIR
jgi:hypothetical protein